MSDQNPPNPNTTERRRQFFRSFEAKSLRSRSTMTQFADDLTAICGSTTFLIFHVIFFTSWIVVNVGLLAPWIMPFDPYPFGFLTMVVSLEAIFLAIFILVSQNRQSYVSSLREEVHLRVNLIAEEEITKVLEVLAEIRKEMGIKKVDKELNEMLERIDTNYIEQSIMQQMERASKPISEQLKKEFPEILLTPVKNPITIIQNLAHSEPNSSKSDTTTKSSS